MANISLTSYDAQLAAAQRRQKLAESLQEQADAPIDIQSYKGVQAPIPWTAVLAKALQGYAAGYQGKKADELKAALGEQTRKGLADYLQQSSANYKIPNIQESPPMRTEQVQQPMAQPVGLQTPQQLTAGGMQGMAARGGTPPALAAALAASGSPPMGATPQTGAMAPPAPFRPQTISVPDMTPQPAMINRPAADRQQMVLQGIASDNPLIRQVAPSMYDQATKDVDKENMVNAIKKIKVEGADSEILGAYAASSDPSKALDYLVSVGNSRAEAAAKLQQIRETAAASAEQRQLDRELRRDQGDQASADRIFGYRMTAANSAASRALTEAMFNDRNSRIPPKIASGYSANNSAIKQIDDAIKAIEDNPGHLGLQNLPGDTAMQRLDPKGVDVRAKVADITAVKRHDLSGASITPKESPYLKPFLPSQIDKDKVAITKLKHLRDKFIDSNSEMEIQYSHLSGSSSGGWSDAKVVQQ